MLSIITLLPCSIPAPNGYCRPGFNCESVMNASCDFSLRAQLLLCNDRFCARDPRVNATLQLWSKMSNATWSLLPVTTFQLLTKQDCQLASPRRWTNWWREQLPVIAVGRTIARKANTIGKYAAENGNTAAIKRFNGQSIVRLFKKHYQVRTRITCTRWVWPNIARTKHNY